MAFLIGGDQDDDAPLAEINVTPLVDVMLVLLIIFMITAPMLHQGYEVALPQTESSEAIRQREEDPLILSLRPDGMVYIRDEPVHPDRLVERLEALLAVRDDRQVFVKGDRELSYGQFVHILDLLYGGGIQQIGLVTDKIVEPRKRR